VPELIDSVQSMTGYGSGRSSGDGLQFSVEIQSVNRRQSELLVHLPRELASVEARIRDFVHARVARGRITVTVAYQAGSEVEEPTSSQKGSLPLIDSALARAYYEAIQRMQGELGLRGSLQIDTVLTLPGVIIPPNSNKPHLTNPEESFPYIEKALTDAVESFLQLRRREGAALLADLSNLLKGLQQLVESIRHRQPEVPIHYRTLYLERIRNAQIECKLDDDRLAKEIAIFADRSDISEELTRLESHLDQFGQLIQKSEPVGRTLDFLGQEIARELNTLGAKANDLTISQFVVKAKAELEKAREQIQNIE
jgi:uncharacterized protein (TIGR00255 family)